MRQLVVHIGNPKAGSMSLQQFLHAHHQELERKGILYPVIDGSRSHGALARLHSGKLITAKQVGMTFPAVRGMNSLICTPGSLVEIGKNSPRTSDVASGLGSNVSWCETPPCSQSKMIDLALPLRRVAASVRKVWLSERPKEPIAPAFKKLRR